MSALIEFNEVCKYYHMGDTVVKALDHVQASSWPSWASPVRASPPA